MFDTIRHETEACLAELLASANLQAGDILVVGCSTSEIMGKRIGSDPTEDAGGAVFGGVQPRIEKTGIWLAAQCCEHLNRALVIEKEAALRYRLPVVSVVPVQKAGGSWASWVYRHMRAPVVVENLDNFRAAAGIDIGETCIGMHLQPVAVMVRPANPWIGKARVTMARTRPKLIGGERAVYGTAF
jgi:uncharacterized protein (TIGR01440 family)